MVSLQKDEVRGSFSCCSPRRASEGSSERTLAESLFLSLCRLCGPGKSAAGGGRDASHRAGRGVLSVQGQPAQR